MQQTTTFAEVAALVAGLGALGVVVAGLNVVARRVVRVDEVPRHVQCRIRWWGAHNSAFLLISAVLTVAGLVGMATAAG